MSTDQPDPPADPTTEQRHERVVAILARAVVRRVRLLRRTDASMNPAPNHSRVPLDDIIVANREILV